MPAPRGWYNVKIGTGFLMLMCLLLFGSSIAAQDGGFFLEIIREPGSDTSASFARIAIDPRSGIPVVMRRASGTRFGTDRVIIEAFDGDWQPLSTNGLLDPQTNIITPKGIDLAFDERGVLFAAVNREFPNDRDRPARTLIARFDAGGWVGMGEPVGRGTTIGPLYLFESNAGLTLAAIENGESFAELRTRVFDGGEWVPLGAPVQNVEQQSDVETLYAVADGEGHPLMAWAEYSEEFGVTFAYADYWDGGRWQEVPEIPLVANIEIGDVLLAGLAAGREGDVFLATREPFERTNFVDIWYQNTNYAGEWNYLGLPDDAGDSECAIGHAIAAGPGDTFYYAWAQPCEGIIRLAIGNSAGEWFMIEETISIRQMRGEAPDLQIAVDEAGAAYIVWVESGGSTNGAMGVAVFVP